MSDFRTIVVDLTPLLPGAVNGGAKILVLELLDRLPRVMADKRFILLTRKSSHDELARFEGANVVRRLIWNDVDPPTPPRPPRKGRKRFLKLGAALTRRLPPSLQRVRFDLRRSLIADVAADDVTEGGTTVLFSPFGLSEAGPPKPHAPGRLPTVAILYDLQHRHYPKFFNPEEIAKREANLESYRSTAVVAAISDFARDSAVVAGALAAEAVSTVYIRLRRRIPEVTQTQIAETLGDLKLSAGRYFLYPANFWPHKNHAALFHGWSLAHDDGLPHDFKLVCTGAPSEGSARVAAEAASRGLEDSLILPGFLTDTQFGALMRASRGVVFPSLYEGFGMPVIEAMGIGCPVACSSGTSLGEIAGDAALLFDPDQPTAIGRAIARLATDDALRAGLIEKGFRRAEPFSDTERMAREYVALFDRAVTRWEQNTGCYLRGVYTDGWAAPSVQVGFGSGVADRIVRLELQAPPLLPIGHFDLSVSASDGSTAASQRLQTGARSVIELPIGSRAGVRHVSIKPYFRPIELYPTADERKLTVQVHRIEIKDATRTETMFSGHGA